MKPDGSVRILRNDGEWRRGVIRATGPTYVTIDVYVVDRWVRDLYPHDTLEAMQALHDATDAVVKARDAVVIAAKAWSKYAPQDARDDAHIDNLQRAVTDLRNAERAESEARARLDALR